jgi:histidinol-phosphate aminotransferase
MKEVELLVRDNIRKLAPYSCARNEYNTINGIFLDANENPFGSLNRYPDPNQTELKMTISEIKNVRTDTIFLGNGSDEIIDLTLRIFCDPGKDHVAIFTPTYGMYRVAAEIHNTSVLEIPLDEDFQINSTNIPDLISDPRIKVIIICSPNNPTGNLVREEDMLAILSGFNGIVVVDEAYIDFSLRESMISRLPDHKNLIVMQTFSKAWGMAGVRIGMAFAHRDIISYYNRVKPPYSISSLNQKAILEKFGKQDTMKKEIEQIVNEREMLGNELQKLDIVDKVFPSQANFLLVKFKDADKVYAILIENEIIVRNRSAVIGNCLRITIGNTDENNKLLESLKQLKK